MGVPLAIEQIGSLELRCAAETDVLRVGDRMRFSVAMIDQIHANVSHSTSMVKVDRIVIEHDGSKTVYMRNIHANTLPIDERQREISELFADEKAPAR